MNAELASEFARDWKNGKTEFTIHTSGSTGMPKAIVLQKRWMQWSANQTAKYIQPKPDDKLFCCLPIDKVGGLMMLVRAMEWNIPVQVAEPAANPLLKATDATIVSLTPMQLSYILDNEAALAHLLQFREVLLGGGELYYRIEEKIKTFTGTIFRHSYGMTETYSHIALRTINGPEHSEWFTPFEEVRIDQDELGCAIIYTPFYQGGLHTNDVIEKNREGNFKVIGRKDFIINSGGIKLQPELIEQKIRERLKPSHGFIISSIKDPILGNKLVLLSEHENDFDLTDLQFLKDINPYAVPKLLIEIDQIPLNAGGKIDRLKALEQINT